MRDTIRNKIKSFFAFLIILFLLPYIISVFINGKNAVQGADSDNASVYLAEMLAGETDGGCEIEALKAQVVVLRTELYRTENAKAMDRYNIYLNAILYFIIQQKCTIKP